MHQQRSSAGLRTCAASQWRPSAVAVPQLRRPTTTAVVAAASLLDADAAVAAAADATSSAATPALGAALVVAALGVGGFRAALYSTLEYAKAAALARFVPKGSATPNSRGAKVVLLGASTRDVYYLPKDTLSAVVIGADVNPSLFDQAGVSAGIPTTGRRVPAGAAWGGSEGQVAAAGTLDAVVALGSCLGKLPPQERASCLREARWALRPGRPLVLLQALAEGASPLRPLVGPGGGSGAMPAAELERALEEAGFGYVEWGVELGGTDPHALGVAVTPQEGGEDKGGEGAAAMGGKRRRREAAEKKGF